MPMLEDFKWFFITILGSIGMVAWVYIMVYVILLAPWGLALWSILPLGLAVYWSRPKHRHH